MKSGWLPWNRRFVTEVVSLAEAADVPMEDYDPFLRTGYRNKCRQCGASYDKYSAPSGYSAFCTQVCVNVARRSGRS